MNLKGWQGSTVTGRIQEVWTSPRGEVVILGVPVHDDETHNCDANGCGQDHVLWRSGAQNWLNDTCLITDRLVCNSCGFWLPMGPSADEDPRVAVEILAAHLAHPVGFIHPAHVDHHDQDWIDEWFNYAFRDDCIACHAEFLAVRILESGEGL